jgi:hypothetical protein
MKDNLVEVAESNWNVSGPDVYSRVDAGFDPVEPGTTSYQKAVTGCACADAEARQTAKSATFQMAWRPDFSMALIILASDISKEAWARDLFPVQATHDPEGA